MKTNKHTRVGLQTSVIPSPEINQINEEDEEAFFLACNEKERTKILEVKITRQSSAMAPSINIRIDTPDEYHESFWLTFTKFGFTLSKSATLEVIAYSIINKNLACESQCSDIEFLRGLSALAFLNLEHQINKHIDAFDMIYSPLFTEYLFKCVEYLEVKE